MTVSCLLLGMLPLNDSTWQAEPSSTYQSAPEFIIYLNLTRGDDDSSYWPLWDRSVQDSELTVRSNGSAGLRLYTEYKNATISTSLAHEAYTALCDEMSPLIGARVEDPAWQERHPFQESRLTVVTAGIQKSVVFEGNSIAGVMPRSTTLLGNIMWTLTTGHADLLDVSIGVSSVPVDSCVSEICVNITNNNEFTIHHSATAQPGNFVVVRSDGVSSLDSGLDSAVSTWLEVPIEPGETSDMWFDAFGSRWNTSDVPPGRYTVMAHVAVDDDPESYNECMYGYIILEVTGQDEGPSSTEALISGAFLYVLTAAMIVAAVVVVLLYRKKKASNEEPIQLKVSESKES